MRAASLNPCVFKRLLVPRPVFTQRLSHDWTLYQALDVKDETDRLKLARFLHDLYEIAGGGIEEEAAEKLTLDMIKTIPIEVEGDTLHLPQPLTAEAVHDLIQFFLKGGLLDKKYVLSILHNVGVLLKTLPPVSFIQAPTNRRKITVVGKSCLTQTLGSRYAGTPSTRQPPGCKITYLYMATGDLHGSYSDLTAILTRIGYPGPNNIVIFNGDFVDRGPKGLEVLLTIMALKLVHPRCVHLLIIRDALR